MTSALTLEALPLLAEMELVVKLLPEVFVRTSCRMS